MWQYGRISAVSQTKRQGQAAADMFHEGQECQEDDLNWLADRPDSLVEGESHRPTVSGFLQFHKCCLSVDVSAERAFPPALMSTRGMVLYHSHGERNPFKTILTEREFCQILTELRDNYDKRDKHLGSIKIVFEDDGTEDVEG